MEYVGLVTVRIAPVTKPRNSGFWQWHGYDVEERYFTRNEIEFRLSVTLMTTLLSLFVPSIVIYLFAHLNAVPS